MTIKEEWLVCQKTPYEFELDALKNKASAFNIPMDKIVQKFADKPFGHMTSKWKEFVSQLLPDDELWYFNTPKKMINQKMGAIGYAIIRKGKIVDTITMLRT